MAQMRMTSNYSNGKILALFLHLVEFTMLYSNMEHESHVQASYSSPLQAAMAAIGHQSPPAQTLSRAGAQSTPRVPVSVRSSLHT